LAAFLDFKSRFTILLFQRHEKFVRVVNVSVWWNRVRYMLKHDCFVPESTSKHYSQKRRLFCHRVKCGTGIVGVR
jgi:hypothetical protein